MKLQHIEYLVSVARAGSISQAAREHYLSQSSMSTAIKNIESKYGIVIFERTSKGVILTREGEELLIDLERVLYRLEYMEDRYTRRNIKDHRFCVSSQHHVGSLEPFVKLLLNLNDVKYRLGFLECKTQEVLINVEKGISDIGVIYYTMRSKSAFLQELKLKSLIFNHIAYSKIHVYLRKDHPLSNNESVYRRELKGYPFITYDEVVDSTTIFTESDICNDNTNQIIYANDRAAVYSIMNSTDAFLVGSGYNNNSEIICMPIIDEQEIEIGWIAKENFDLTSLAKEYTDLLIEGMRV